VAKSIITSELCFVSLFILLKPPKLIEKYYEQ